MPGKLLEKVIGRLADFPSYRAKCSSNIVRLDRREALRPQIFCVVNLKPPSPVQVVPLIGGM